MEAIIVGGEGRAHPVLAGGGRRVNAVGLGAFVALARRLAASGGEGQGASLDVT